jgi:type IV secretory pathway VirB10-like protein
MIFAINGEAREPAPAAPAPIAPQPETVAVNPESLSAADLEYLRRRQRPGLLDTQFDPAAYTAMTAQQPIQDNWRSIGYGPNLSSMPVDMTRVVTMDKPIPAVIKLPIDSREASRAVATVERDIYGGDGSTVVIERGSTLIGTAAAIGSATEEKVGISWERLVRPDGSAWALQATSGDAMGRSGVIGFIDSRWMERFGVSLLASAVVSGLDIVTNAGQTTTQSASGNTTTTQTPAYIAGQQFSGNFQTLYSQFAKEQMQITPIISIPVGTRITVFATTDLWLRPINPNQDMRVAYARAASGSPSFLAAQEKAQTASRAVAADRGDGVPTVVAAPIAPTPRISATTPVGASATPLTPVSGPSADLAPDSSPTAATGQSGFAGDPSANSILANSISAARTPTITPGVAQPVIQTQSPWIPVNPVKP